MTASAAASREKLAADLKAVISDTEELLKATAGQAGERVQAARSRAEETLRSAKARLTELGEAGLEQARAAARATDSYVHENPWPAVGVAAAVGFLMGLLLGRK